SVTHRFKYSLFCERVRDASIQDESLGRRPCASRQDPRRGIETYYDIGAIDGSLRYVPLKSGVAPVKHLLFLGPIPKSKQSNKFDEWMRPEAASRNVRQHAVGCTPAKGHRKTIDEAPTDPDR